MHLYYQEYLDRLNELHAGIQKELSGLPAEALDWVPMEGMNSLAVLVTHLTGAERYWIGDVGMGEASNRDREAEFRAAGLGAGALMQRLEQTQRYTAGALERLTLADLERECTSPRDGKKYTASWALLHALEHTAIHLGHIQVSRQLWEARS